MRTKCAKMLYEYCTNVVRFLSPRAGTRDENQKRVTIQLASANLETRPAFGPSRPSRGAVPTKRSEYGRHKRFLLPREGYGLQGSKRRPDTCILTTAERALMHTWNALLHGLGKKCNYNGLHETQSYDCLFSWQTKHKIVQILFLSEMVLRTKNEQYVHVCLKPGG